MQSLREFRNITFVTGSRGEITANRGMRVSHAIEITNVSVDGSDMNDLQTDQAVSLREYFRAPKPTHDADRYVHNSSMDYHLYAGPAHQYQLLYSRELNKSDKVNGHEYNGWQ